MAKKTETKEKPAAPSVESEVAKTEAEASTTASKGDIAAHAASVDAGVNSEGMLSPDPKVGSIVPSDLVKGDEAVDPKTGKVLKGSATPSAVAPQPNPKANGPQVKPAAGEDWVGGHTV